MRLKDQVAIITGSGRGIGREMASSRAQGARVVVADIDLTTAQDTVSQIMTVPGESWRLAVDITVPAQVEDLIQQTLQRFGRLDILVNNAAIGTNTPFLETSLEEWERVLRINLTARFCAPRRRRARW